MDRSAAMMGEAREWIDRLRLAPHPEGGWFRETYRADEEIAAAALPARFGGVRAFSTAIYFLLDAPAVSALHRIRSDEVWHFYRGDALTVFTIAADGVLGTSRLGADPGHGETFQLVVRGGTWFGAALDRDDAFALVGCTVAPGFDFADFELAERAELIARFPQHRAMIERLTRA